ncbi:MAG: cytochrome C oxidase subunit IV family protein [Candidatus Omnitrophica bacterium]|nr:cytochrome C oxidase subunit IV family protein [Candidatus Omnitrophota bacterium]
MAHAPVMSTSKYVMIWVWLAGLMLLGVALSELPIAPRTIFLLVLGLSTVKAMLVAAYYMHLRFDDRLLTMVALSPVPLVMVLVIALLLDKPHFLH